MEPISATYIRSVSSNSPRTWPRFDFLVSMSYVDARKVKSNLNDPNHNGWNGQNMQTIKLNANLNLADSNFRNI